MRKIHSLLVIIISRKKVWSKALRKVISSFEWDFPARNDSI
jgi:hypothetical protein